jgi:hypothetical protein
MADQAAFAAVSSTLRTLLLDRMVTASDVTLAPPDTQVSSQARVNLYLMQVMENAELKNQEIPFHGSPAAYGTPPLSLNLRYLMTTHSESEDQDNSDLNAQTLLGDAMRVLHDFGNRIDTLRVLTSVGGLMPGDPILDPRLADEFERLRVTLHPSTIDDLTKIWSALPDASFRRSVVYEVTVVQIETPQPRTLPRPVERRRILATVRSRPVITAAYVKVDPSVERGEVRVRIGDSITIEASNTTADKLYVRLGALDPIRVIATGGRVTIDVPDDTYPIDLDNSHTRPIPVSQQLQPGTLNVQLIAQRTDEGVEGALDHGSPVSTVGSHVSNIAILQLVPGVAQVSPTGGTSSTVLTITGTRLWNPAAREAEVDIGDAGVQIRAPGPGDVFAAPTATSVQIPVTEIVGRLPVQAPADPAYPLGVQIDGARSRDNVGFHFNP